MQGMHNIWSDNKYACGLETLQLLVAAIQQCAAWLHVMISIDDGTLQSLQG